MPEKQPQKPSVILEWDFYTVMRHLMLDEDVKRDGEMIRRVLARDPGMRQKAEALGIDLDRMVVRPIGGHHPKIAEPG